MQEKCTQRTQSDRTPLRGKEADRAILAKNFFKFVLLYAHKVIVPLAGKEAFIGYKHTLVEFFKRKNAVIPHFCAILQ